LGDSAATIELSTVMRKAVNDKVLSIQKWFEENGFAGLKDIIVAYSSLTLVYDPFVISEKYRLLGSSFQWVENKIEQAYLQASMHDNSNINTHRIPVCYDEEFGVDLRSISQVKNISLERIIALHVSKVYRVYMLGFLPGFAYMGEVEAELLMPRKDSPVPVEAGSVGIVSTQTGIYPLPSPGGWQIIGQTPVKLFDPKAEHPVKLKSGDQVHFYKITREEFDRWQT
jgi:inhibitor of KinA